ncbi:hypothetical protein QF023_001484 [Chryseobacterium sp. SLBN-27]|uniref:hypothetical protein n=1 Tax=Chryseobacterium sp. SLBN-27 TaxID=3042287 RepID=UPI002857701C|nr:hypothetical protein [Chryseobacterium sp. SLBN-27]MDR6157968.1 hypothetical protein [Chryseobacterium sp. SLBN-27]
MKNILKISIFLLLLLSLHIKAQLDTLNYLKQFEANKAHYIAQPFSKLLNDMTQIQPKTVWSNPVRNNRNIVVNTRFKFCEMNNSFHNTITLGITWETSIPRSQIVYYEQLNGFYFTNDEKLFYGSKIVKDIRVYR